MTDLNEILFSPLGTEWCEYFRILMYLTFLAFIMTIVASFGHFFMDKKNRLGIFTYLLGIGQSGLTYFVMRLFYSMCIR